MCDTEPALVEEVAMRWVAAAAAVVALAVSAAPAIAHPPSSVQGFTYDESVWWDGETGSFFVTNFGGSTLDPNGRDPDGWISKLSGEGRMVAAKWVTGLRSPKGMRRLGKDLYVADVGQVVVVDVGGGKIAATIDLDPLGAKFPNDVAVDEVTGDVFVSDTGANAIYRIPRGTTTPEVWLSSPDLESPNGLLVDGDKLVVAGSTNPGRVLVVDRASKAVTPLGGMAPIPGAQLDGIEKQGDTYLVTDHPGGRLLRVAANGSVKELAKDLKTPADIGWRPGDNTLGVPELSASDVRFLVVPSP
jgi:hypothetical protein